MTGNLLHLHMLNTSIKNLVLRPLNIEDAGEFFELINRNRARLCDYFPKTISMVTDPGNAGAYVQQRVGQAVKKEFLSFVLADENNELQGYISLKNFDWEVPKCELAYFIDADYEGKGIMTNAMGVIVTYCFETLQLNKLYLTTAADNYRSRKMVENNGFEMEGLLRKDFKHSTGVLVDMVYYGIIRQV
jgi:ribosomal-protein-serine acetyltransferase